MDNNFSSYQKYIPATFFACEIGTDYNEICLHLYLLHKINDCIMALVAYV